MMVTVELTPHQVDALTNFAYNCGVAALRKSTLLKLVNQNPKNPKIRDAFMMWTKAGGKVLPGLVRRREAEADLFMNG